MNKTSYQNIMKYILNRKADLEKSNHAIEARFDKEQQCFKNLDRENHLYNEAQLNLLCEIMVDVVDEYVEQVAKESH